jgi:hypothetical protein
MGTTMTQTGYRYIIRSEWGGRTEAPAAVGTRFLKTLAALSDLDPIFSEWEIFDAYNMSSISVSTAQSRMAAIIEDNVVRDDHGKPLPSSYGYYGAARAGRFKDPRSALFEIEAGGKYLGSARLKFGDYNFLPDPAIITYPLFKTALLALNASWLAPWACAQAISSSTVKVPIDLGGVQATRIDSAPLVPGGPAFPESIFQIPWIAYLSADLARGLKLTPEMLTERTSDGGLLMSATTERFEPGNPEHLRRARIILETLLACTGYSPYSSG